MRLTDDIAKLGSVAIVGMAKNVGKTETLNHIIRETYRCGLKTGLTSIGVDGESIDSVTSTRKPEITLRQGMLFATSETHYRARRLEAEILDIGVRRTALGRVVTGRALSDGKLLLSGPADTQSLKALINRMHTQGAQTVIVDGALSRLSPASPAVTDGMVLATGAALSHDIATIVKKTTFICRLIDLPLAHEELVEKLLPLDRGVWAIGAGNEIIDTGLDSAIKLARFRNEVPHEWKAVYASGMISDKTLRFLATDMPLPLIARDFTKLFVEPQTLTALESRGGKVSVLQKTALLAVTINPWSPNGYTVDSSKLKAEMQSRVNVPVLNIRDV